MPFFAVSVSEDREDGVAGFCLFRFDGRLIEMLGIEKGGDALNAAL